MQQTGHLACHLLAQDFRSEMFLFLIEFQTKVEWLGISFVEFLEGTGTAV